MNYLNHILLGPSFPRNRVIMHLIHSVHPYPNPNPRVRQWPIKATKKDFRLSNLTTIRSILGQMRNLTLSSFLRTISLSYADSEPISVRNSTNSITRNCINIGLPNATLRKFEPSWQKIWSYLMLCWTMIALLRCWRSSFRARSASQSTIFQFRLMLHRGPFSCKFSRKTVSSSAISFSQTLSSSISGLRFSL